VDVTDPKSVAEAVERLDGPIDAVVLAAGVSRMAPLLETSDDDWHVQMNVNAYGVFNCLRALVPVMVRGGSIAVIDSMAGLRGAPYLSAYCASKFAVSGLIESATPELAVRDIRVNGICPMYVRTPMEDRELGWEGQLRGLTPQQVFAEYESTTPLGRVAEPTEIAAVAAFLVSDDSSYITGSLMPVSGGAHLGFTVERNEG
jgi:NAD(P)-dependent dehydrogenase (short-subunit alcohol dehydrogenase family)